MPQSIRKEVGGGGGGEGEGGKQDKDKIGMQEELNEDLKCKDQKS